MPPSSTSQRWRWAIRVTLCLALGLVTSVAVAWGIALWPGSIEMPHPEPLDRQDAAAVWYAPRGWREELRTNGALQSNLIWDERFHASRGLYFFKLAAWGDFGIRVSRVTRESAYAIVAADLYHLECGWPLPQFWATTTPTGDAEWSRAIDLRHTRCGRKERWTVLGPGGANPLVVVATPVPLGVLPIGTLANTTIYALAWLVLPLAANSVRRALRRHHGCCTRCGYDLTTLTTCPECGTPRS